MKRESLKFLDFVRLILDILLDILLYMYVCVRACVRVHVCIVSINHIVPFYGSENIYPMFPNAGTSPFARWSLVAARRFLLRFRMVPCTGRWTPSVIRKSSKMITHGLCASWRPGVSVTVLWDDLHRSHRCLRWICQSCEGVVPIGHPLRGWVHVAPRSCRRCLNHRCVVCDILKRLAPYAALKLVCSIPIGFLDRRW